MLFAARVTGHQAVALADTGADGEYISARFLQDNNLLMAMQAAGRETECAGGQSLAILGSYETHFRMGTFSANLKFHVVPELLKGVDIILGRSFMKAYRVIPDVAGRRIRLKPPGKKTTTIRSLTLARTSSGVGAIRRFLRKSIAESSEVGEPLSAKRAWKRQAPSPSSFPPEGWLEKAGTYQPRPSVVLRDTKQVLSGTHRHVGNPGERCQKGIPDPKAGTKHTTHSNARMLANLECTPGKHPSKSRAPEAEGVTKGLNKMCGEDPEAGGDRPGTTCHSGCIPEAQLEQLLAEYAEVFPADLPPGLPPEREIGHVIQLQQNSIPPYRRNRRMSPSEVALCEEYIKDLLHKGFIAPSTSPFGAPVMFIAKASGGYRVVCDWRALNNITIKNRYPLPRIDETLDRLGGSTVFSSLDLNSGYFEIRISEEDAPKTAFTTPLGQYEFKVLGQGLANSPATFQSVMNRIFSPHLYKFVVVYLDDIMVFSKSPEEHLEHLRIFLDLLRKNRFYAKKEKCSFNIPEVKFLGHIVGRDGLKVDPKKVDTVTNWPTPENATEVRQFLGLTNYFRKFI